MKSFIRLFATVESTVNMAHFNIVYVRFHVQCAESDGRTWRETNINIVKMSHIYDRFSQINE